MVDVILNHDLASLDCLNFGQQDSAILKESIGFVTGNQVGPVMFDICHNDAEAVE